MVGDCSRFQGTLVHQASPGICDEHGMEARVLSACLRNSSAKAAQPCSGYAEDVANVQVPVSGPFLRSSSCRYHCG